MDIEHGHDEYRDDGLETRLTLEHLPIRLMVTLADNTRPVNTLSAASSARFRVIPPGR